MAGNNSLDWGKDLEFLGIYIILGAMHLKHQSLATLPITGLVVSAQRNAHSNLVAKVFWQSPQAFKARVVALQPAASFR